MKDAFYFPHDSNAHNDPKILALRLKCGWEGVGIFWALIEILRDAPDYKYTFDLATLELGLSTPQATLQATLEAGLSVGLFVKKDGFFSSPSLDRRMSEIDRRRDVLREAGRRGGIKSSQAQARLKPPSSSKVKESKVKESIIAPAGHFIKPTTQEIEAYCQERGNGLNSQKIFDHYEASGWKRGKTPISNWKACVRTWENIKQKTEVVG